MSDGIDGIIGESGAFTVNEFGPGIPGTNGIIFPIAKWKRIRATFIENVKYFKIVCSIQRSLSTHLFTGDDGAQANLHLLTNRCEMPIKQSRIVVNKYGTGSKAKVYFDVNCLLPNVN